MSDAKITELTELTDPTGEDLLAVVDDVAGTPIIKKTTIQKIADLFASLTQTLTNKTLTSPVINTPTGDWLESVYPVGCIFISTVSTNPNTVFGFGTWAVFGAGKTLVGLDSGDADFDASEETGGAKTHTLTEAEMPSHNHTLSGLPNNVAGIAWVGSSGTGENTTRTTSTTGSDNAHNNLQPYIVTYMFKRTA